MLPATRAAIEEAVSLFGFVLILCTVGSSVLGYFWVVRPYDRLLGRRSLSFEYGVPFFSTLFRLHGYCRGILRPPAPLSYEHRVYGDFDFRKHASRRQVVLSRTFLLSLHTLTLVSLAFGAYLYLTDR